MKTGLTLMELLIAAVITTIILLLVGSIYPQNFNSILIDMHLSNARMQVDYAMENIRLHSKSAISLNPTPFFTRPGETNTIDSFRFQGEQNIYNVTPDNLTDNANYWYRTNAGNLVLTTNYSTSTEQEEVLIESAFFRNISFIYQQGDDPNLLRVNITAQVKNYTITKNEAISLWFTSLFE